MVDEFDDFHVVHEAFYHNFDDPPTGQIGIGYKNRSATNWSASGHPIIVASESGDQGSGYPCGSMSPHLFLQETSGVDTLHCSYRRPGPCAEHSNWLTYRRTPLLASNKWRSEGESYVTGEIGSGDLLVESQGKVHFVGVKAETILVVPPYRRFTVLHYSGFPPDPGEEWEAEARDEIAEYNDQGCTGPEPPPELDIAFSTALRGAGNYIYIAFHKIVQQCRREIFLTRVSTSTGDVDPPVQISPSGDIPSVAPNLVITADGAFHLMYNEPGSTGLTAWDTNFSADVFHMWTSGDPMVPANWSTPDLVTFERREGAQFPEFHASHDSVWALYTCHDDDTFQECDPLHGGLEQDCDWEVWAQNGYAIADSVAIGQTMTWSGAVYLDADFIVPVGSTLVIEPGTKIFVNSQDARNQGIDSQRIEIIVRGHLVAPGSAASPIIVAGKTGTGAGEWYGFRFDGAPTAGSSTSLDYVSFRNAFRAVTVDTLGFNLRNCTFAQSSEADIYIDRDFRIPVGKEWILPAPLKALVRNTDAAPKSWGQDAAKCEILVEGALRSFRPTGASPSDSVRFVATTIGANGWTGITIGELATGSIYDAVIASATDAISFYGAGYARVWNSRIYDFKDVGILDWGSNAWIKGCKLTKAVGTEPLRKAIQLIGSTGRIENNNVGFMEKWGIRAEFNASYCNSPIAADTLVISGNTLTGNAGDNGTSNGISVSRGCDHRHPRIRNNVVTKWSAYGLDLNQCAETRVHGNTINDNWRGLQYVRNSNAVGGPVRLYRNDFQINTNRNVLSTESYSLSFREPVLPDSAGNNRFRQETEETVNFVATDPVSVIDAQRNLWMRLDGSVILEADTTEIRDTFDEDPAGRVTIARVLTSGGGPETLRGPGEIEVPSELSHESPTWGTNAIDAIPAAFQISSIRPNPFTGSVRIRYDVPNRVGRELSLVVHDVSGRVVRRLIGEPPNPGRHEAVWNGRDTRGQGVSSGIYFIRLEAGDFRQTKKVVALRSGGEK